jgi:DNA-binding transcriptional MerR regulator
MPDPAPAPVLDQFSSPIRKLVPFFKRSRDAWKAKYMKLKAARKLMENQVRAVEKSREIWKQRAETSEARLAEVESELERLKKTASKR